MPIFVGKLEQVDDRGQSSACDTVGTRPKEVVSFGQSGSGIYLEGEINDVKIPLLLDTGAQVSLMDFKFWQQCGDAVEELQKCSTKVSAVN